jgi:hypothetical protein
MYSMREIYVNNVRKRKYKLVRKKQDSFKGELATAKVEQVFKRWTEQINHHSIL